MSNSLWFSRIFTLQSSSWSCFNFYWLFLQCTWKDYYESEKFFITIELKNFQNFSFSFLKYINFKITTNSFKYSLVEQFFENHFHKSNYRGVRGVYFLKNLINFFGFIYPPYLGCGGGYYTSNILSYTLFVFVYCAMNSFIFVGFVKRYNKYNILIFL